MVTWNSVELELRNGLNLQKSLQVDLEESDAVNKLRQ